MRRRIATFCPSSFLILALASAGATAQEDLAWPWAPSFDPELRLREGREASVTLRPRGSFPLRGEAVESFADYADLFKFGVGVGVEGALLWSSGPHSESWGPYVSLGWDRFSGTEEDDDFQSLDTDDWDVFTGLVGLKVAETLGEDGPSRAGRFMAEAYAGVGGVSYRQVDAEYSLLGISFGDVEIIDNTFNFAAEAGVRVGYGTPSVAFQIGGGLRFFGAPDGGSDVTSDPDPLFTAIVDLGVQLRF